jgi:hypothetical protein
MKALRLLLIIVSSSLVFASASQNGKEVIARYFDAFKYENYDSLRDIIGNEKLLDRHIKVMKVLHQKLKEWHIEKSVRSGRYAVYAVRSRWTVYNFDGTKHYESDTDASFVLEFDGLKWHIVNILPKKLYDDIVRSYFYTATMPKEGAKHLAKTFELLSLMENQKRHYAYEAPKYFSSYQQVNVTLHRDKFAEEWFKDWNVVRMPVDKRNEPKIIFTKERYGWFAKPSEITELHPPKGVDTPVLCLHPVAQDKPSVLQTFRTIDEKSRFLYLHVTGESGKDWLLRVKVNGDTVFEKVIRGDKWHRVKIDLSKYMYKNAHIEVQIAANDWYYEFAFIDDIRFKKE